MTQERKKLVELKNVSLTFNKGKSNEVKAIDDVSFDIYEGEILAQLVNLVQVKQPLGVLF